MAWWFESMLGGYLVSQLKTSIMVSINKKRNLMLKSIFKLEPNFNYYKKYTQNWVFNFIYVGNWSQN